MSGSNGTTERQIAAIKKIIGLARSLKNKHPEIANLYRSGMFVSRIEAELSLSNSYGVSVNVARQAIGFAIRGHSQGYGLDAFEGLITDREELSRLESEHKTLNGAEIGNYTRDARIGVFAMSKEDIVNAGKASVLARGRILWRPATEESVSEEDYLLRIHAEHEHSSGRYAGRINYNSLANAMNEEYHNGEKVRSEGTIRARLTILLKRNGHTKSS
ncbi:MAG: hypothetical protein AABY10_05055 [Nanoarchaeota archaeon]